MLLQDRLESRWLQSLLAARVYVFKSCQTAKGTEPLFWVNFLTPELSDKKRFLQHWHFCEFRSPMFFSAKAIQHNLINFTNRSQISSIIFLDEFTIHQKQKPQVTGIGILVCFASIHSKIILNTKFVPRNKSKQICQRCKQCSVDQYLRWTVTWKVEKKTSLLSQNVFFILILSILSLSTVALHIHRVLMNSCTSHISLCLSIGSAAFEFRPY